MLLCKFPKYRSTSSVGVARQHSSFIGLSIKTKFQRTLSRIYIEKFNKMLSQLYLLLLCVLAVTMAQMTHSHVWYKRALPQANYRYYTSSNQLNAAPQWSFIHLQNPKADSHIRQRATGKHFKRNGLTYTHLWAKRGLRQLSSFNLLRPLH
jgi:hypothetical protein